MRPSPQQSGFFSTQCVFSLGSVEGSLHGSALWAEIPVEAASLPQGPFLCLRADEVGLIMTNLEKANQVSSKQRSPAGGGALCGGWEQG